MDSMGNNLKYFVSTNLFCFKICYCLQAVNMRKLTDFSWYP
jgi:hypothetical protein